MARIGYAIVVVILVSGLFSFWQEYRVERTLDALQKLLPQRNQALRNSDVVQLPAEDLVVGDVVLLEQGDNVPCLLYTSPSPRDGLLSRMPSSA